MQMIIRVNIPKPMKVTYRKSTYLQIQNPTAFLNGVRRTLRSGSFYILMKTSTYFVLLRIVAKIVMQMIKGMVITKTVKDKDQKSIYLQIQNPKAFSYGVVRT